MSWQIFVPFRRRDESLTAVAGHVRELPGQDEDRAAARQLVLAARLDGLATAGQLIDHLEALTPTERREMLDAARAEQGLEPTGMVDARVRLAKTATAVELVCCAAPGCLNAPTRLGIPYFPNVRRWWCAAHVNEAAPGDMEPIGSGLRLSPAGVPIPVDPADDAREAAVAESDRRQREARHAEREHDAREAAEHEEALREQLRTELPAHPKEAV